MPLVRGGLGRDLNVAQEKHILPPTLTGKEGRGRLSGSGLDVQIRRQTICTCVGFSSAVGGSGKRAESRERGTGGAERPGRNHD